MGVGFFRSGSNSASYQQDWWKSLPHAFVNEAARLVGFVDPSKVWVMEARSMESIFGSG